MRKWVIKKIRCNAISATESWNIIKIDKDPELNPMMNQACHYNSLNEYRAKRAVAIVEVFGVIEGCPIAHYISMSEHGEYYDATLGWSWSGVEYRVSRYIHTMDVDDMSKTLGGFKSRLVNMSPKWLVRLKRILLIEDGDIF